MLILYYSTYVIYLYILSTENYTSTMPILYLYIYIIYICDFTDSVADVQPIIPSHGWAGSQDQRCKAPHQNPCHPAPCTEIIWESPQLCRWRQSDSPNFVAKPVIKNGWGRNVARNVVLFGHVWWKKNDKATNLRPIVRKWTSHN